MRHGIDSHIIEIVEIFENEGQILCKMSTITMREQDFA